MYAKQAASALPPSIIEQASAMFSRAFAHKTAYSLHGNFETLSKKAMFEHAESFDETKQIAFTFAIIALSAKLIKAGGNVSKQEYLAFRAAFPLQPNQDSKIRSLFMMALNEDSPAEQYARLIASLFAGRKDLYRDVLESLLTIATSDKAMQQHQYDYLSNVAKIFSFKRSEWKSIVRNFSAPALSSPYQTLGVRKNVSNAELKNHYRDLMRRYHPDHHQAAGTNSDMMELMTMKVASLNEAYSAIQQERAGNENNKSAKTGLKKRLF